MRSLKQKRRSLDPKRSIASKEEANKLKDNDFIRDALNLDWVSTHVLVKKANEK